MNRLNFLIIPFCLFAVFTASCKLEGGSTPADPGYVEILNNLGLDTGALNEPRVDAGGNALGQDYNPLSSGKRTVLFKQCDLYMAGMRPTGASGYDGLFELTTAGIDNGTLSQDADSAWAANFYSKSVAADMDGDGTDEVVIAVFDTTRNYLTLKMIKKDPAGQYNYTDIRDLHDENITAQYFTSPENMTITAGDVDGDGRDEIVVAYYAVLRVFDDSLNNYALMSSYSFPTYTTTDDYYYGAAMADFDADGCYEIAASFGSDQGYGGYIIFEDLKHSAQLSIMSCFGSNGNMHAYGRSQEDLDDEYVNLIGASVETGDINGDKIPDVVFAGANRDNGNRLYALILAGSINDNSGLSFSFLNTFVRDNQTNRIQGPLALGNFNNEGGDEIAMYDTVYTLDSSADEDKIVFLDGIDSIGVGDTWFDGLCFGDIDGDFIPELLRLNHDRNQITIYIFDSASNITATGTIGVGRTMVSNMFTHSFCMPSIKSPAVVLEYTGHEIKLTELKVIAVLAAPPFYSSLGGSNDKNAIQPSLYMAGTVFGESTGSGNGSSESNGFSVGASVGFHAEAPFWGSAFSMTAKVTVDQSFDWSTSNSSTKVSSYSFTNGTSDDLVIFSVVPMDCYYYRVLNAPESSAIETSYMVSLPRKPVTTGASRTYYNENNGDFFDIDNTYMSHVIGVPSSYPTSVEMESIKAEKTNGFYVDDGLTVFLGDYFETMNFSDNQEQASSFGYDLSIGREFELVVGGVLAGGSHAYNYSSNCTVSATSGTEVEGTVASLSEEYATANDGYAWGLMAYPVEDTENEQAYTVVNYWVDMD